jgi:hypothetical protein
MKNPMDRRYHRVFPSLQTEHMFYNILGRFPPEVTMIDSESPKKSTRKPRRKKSRRHVWFEATVQNDHVHVEATAPTKWFRVLRWVILIIVIALIMRFLPEVWQAIQLAIQTVPK